MGVDDTQFFIIFIITPQEKRDMSKDFFKNVTGKAGVDTGKAVDFQRDDCGVILYIRCAVTEFTLLVHKCLVSVLSM